MNFSSILSIETRYSPIRGDDTTYDTITDFLRNKTYPIFISEAHDEATAKAAFEKKCEVFFLDKTGELLHGRAEEIHRHVLRRGELRSVVQFVHYSLGHCNAEVCKKIICPVLWSNESMDIRICDEVKLCGCRQNSSRRKMSCDLEMNNGFTLMLRSTSNNIDLAMFQWNGANGQIHRKLRDTKSDSVMLDDGRYRIVSNSEMQDILEKLHVTFAHCAAFSLRILFRSHFFYPGFSVAAEDLCSRCWFCKLQGRRRRRLPIKNYEYDVEVLGNITDSSRKFVIRPHASVLQAVNENATPEETESKKLRSADTHLIDITNKDVELPIPRVKARSRKGKKQRRSNTKASKQQSMHVQASGDSAGSCIHCSDLDSTTKRTDSTHVPITNRQEERYVSVISSNTVSHDMRANDGCQQHCARTNIGMHPSNKTTTESFNCQSPSEYQSVNDDSAQSYFKPMCSSSTSSMNYRLMCQEENSLVEDDKLFDDLKALEPLETQYLSHLMNHDIDSTCGLEFADTSSAKTEGDKDDSLDSFCDLSAELSSTIDVTTPLTSSRDISDILNPL
ncbi:hypothetical protein DICVIV_00945 [Dictyocaulus viviparus]|uniref:Integrase zinc-binding domain-containing protein n=1 Tax=Dictyocaulus viviparus TaxID=29172 RepID=A0A0D8YA88_DICVI|nr:hypothetical protein DICVIV_00945 [Dictyocaulus viviparus]